MCPEIAQRRCCSDALSDLDVISIRADGDAAHAQEEEDGSVGGPDDGADQKGPSML
jgi:hypothetical protein